jgi:hypothetical protein
MHLQSGRAAGAAVPVEPKLSTWSSAKTVDREIVKRV